MPEDMEVGCARPTGGPVGENIEREPLEEPASIREVTSMIQVGKKAPDFTAPGYQAGKFISTKLSDYTAQEERKNGIFEYIGEMYNKAGLRYLGRAASNDGFFCTNTNSPY